MISLPLSRVSGGRDLWSPPLRDEPRKPRSAVVEILNEVLDPELPIGLVDLGLVYGVTLEGPPQRRCVRVRITYTATACPCQEFIREDIRDRLGREPWIEGVEIEEVWDPPWTTARVSPEGRRLLASFGVGT